MKLSFMTWLCPEWSIDTILKAAKKYGYDGVEIRVESEQKHGIELTSDKKYLSDAKKKFSDAGVEISCVATSLQFAIEDKKKREENIETLKKYIDLSSEIGSPYIRVFGGQIPEGELPAIISYTAESLVNACDHAIGTDVEVLLETHDNFSNSNRVAAVLREAMHRKLNVLWDVMHPCRQLETFEEAYAHIRQYVRHCHIHDGRFVDKGSKIDTCLLGEGSFDHSVPMRLLKKDNFNGHFSVEIIGKGEPDKWISQYAKKFREIEKNPEM